MKMSGTKQKGTGKRNYSILMRHCNLYQHDTHHFLQLIFLCVRWFALYQRYTSCHGHFSSIITNIQYFVEFSSRFRQQITSIRVIEILWRVDLLSISYSLKTFLFQSEIKLCNSQKRYEVNIVLSTQLSLCSSLRRLQQFCLL